MRTSELQVALEGRGETPAIISGSTITTYRDLDRERRAWSEQLADAGVTGGSVVALEADYPRFFMGWLRAMVTGIGPGFRSDFVIRV